MRPHLMIIDDSPDQLSLMLTALRMVNPELKVITANNGEEALQLLRANRDQSPKVILLDLRMPGKNGQEVLEELKADNRFRRIPVCMFSNGDLEKDVCRSYELGASFYFKKPATL